MKNQNIEIFKYNEFTVLKILSEELDLLKSHTMLNTVDAMLNDLNNINLIINLDNVSYIDSAGLTFLYSLKKKYSYKFKSVAVLSSSKSVHKIFSIFDMKKHFPLYENIESIKIEIV